MIRLAALPCLLLVAGAADAASRHLAVTGASLAIDSPCARKIVVEPQPAAGAAITLDADADHAEEVDQLVLTGGDQATLTVPQRCWRPGLGLNFAPTMVMTLHVPPRLPIAVDESSAAIYELGDIGSALTLDLSGAGDVHAANVAALHVDMSGAGQVTVGRAAGPLRISMSGYGSLEIGNAALPAATIEISGKGDVHIGTGTIGKLSVSSSGVGSVTADGTVGDASVELSGVGSVHIARLTGTLSKEVSGVGDVVVGQK